jgi:large subunit ribosomal protein L23
VAALRGGRPVRDPYTIIVRPHITEKAVDLSQGDPRIRETENIVHRYTFIVSLDANKIEIKQAIEAIYNKNKTDKQEKIIVDRVNTVRVKGKSRRVGMRKSGKKPDFKKAVVTLAKGQTLEDYGV